VYWGIEDAREWFWDGEALWEGGFQEGWWGLVGEATAQEGTVEERAIEKMPVTFDASRTRASSPVLSCVLFEGYGMGKIGKFDG